MAKSREKQVLARISSISAHYVVLLRIRVLAVTLIAKCTHVAQGKLQRLTASEHVYLPRSGRFLPLRLEYSPRSTRTYEYTSIRFSK